MSLKTALEGLTIEQCQEKTDRYKAFTDLLDRALEAQEAKYDTECLAILDAAETICPRDLYGQHARLMELWRSQCRERLGRSLPWWKRLFGVRA